MASGPIMLWQTDGGKMETVTDFIFLDSKITKTQTQLNDKPYWHCVVNWQR